MSILHSFSRAHISMNTKGNLAEFLFQLLTTNFSAHFTSVQDGDNAVTTLSLDGCDPTDCQRSKHCSWVLILSYMALTGAASGDITQYELHECM